MNIDEMQAGREMDKAISQYVFGNTKFVCRECEDDYHVVNEQNGLIAYIPVPEFSTDITAAWEVVEKMQLLGFRYAIGKTSIANGERITHKAMFQKNFPEPFRKNYKRYKTSRALTAPLAICRAALKALGVTT